MKNIDLFITTGGGPAECRTALTALMGIVSKQADAAGCSCQPATVFEGDTHGPKSVILSIEGMDALEFARSFEGSIKFIFQSPIRKGHARKNWFLSGSMIELPDASVAEPRPQDMIFETFQAGGPGGQHQNKTDSAVRLRHVPTGIAVVSRNERSQHQNKKVAIQMLLKVLTMDAKAKENDGRRSVFKMNKDIERGNAVQTFKL